MNNKQIKLIEEMNKNRCLFCNRIVLGLSPCNCTEKLENQKLWDKKSRRSK